MCTTELGYMAGLRNEFARRNCKIIAGSVDTVDDHNLRYQGEKLNRRFDAVSYVRLTQAMNGHDVARGRGSYHAVIAGIHQPALVVSVGSDLLYPPHEQQVLARWLPSARYEILDSDDGHDGFLIESAQLGRMIGRFRRAQLGSRSRPGVSTAAATFGAGAE